MPHHLSRLTASQLLRFQPGRTRPLRSRFPYGSGCIGHHDIIESSTSSFRVRLTMWPFTFLGPTWCFSKGSSQIGGVGSIRVGNSPVSRFGHLQWAPKKRKIIETNPSIIIFPYFPLIFSSLKVLFLGPSIPPFSFRSPGETQVTSGIPEWVCGRSTRSTSTVTTVAGLAAPIVVMPRSPKGVSYCISKDLHFIQMNS